MLLSIHCLVFSKQQKCKEQKMNSHEYVPRGQHANIPRDKTKRNEKTRHKTAIKYKYLTNAIK